MRNGYIEVLFGLVDYRPSLRNVKSAVRRHLNDRSSFQDEDDSDGRMATNSSWSILITSQNYAICVSLLLASYFMFSQFKTESLWGSFWRA